MRRLPRNVGRETVILSRIRVVPLSLRISIHESEADVMKKNFWPGGSVLMLKHKKNMNTIYLGVLGRRGLGSLVAILGMMFVIGHANGQMVHNFVPQEAKTEISGQPAIDDRFMALDQKKWKRPQSFFNWVAMARDIKVPWDFFWSTRMDD